jgi:hypothetical protein
MFIGQTRIWSELEIILPELRSTGNNTSFLLRAPSGYGKTIMSFKMANYLDPNNYYYLLPNNDGIINLNLNKRVYIIDEAQTCSNQEIFYPLIDSGRYIFIFTTNEAGELREPLQNRCINYIFSEYNDDELREMVDIYLVDKPVGFNYYPYFTNYSRCPRVLNRLCQRLGYIFRNRGIPHSELEFRSIFENVLNIRDGLDEQQLRYIRFLLTTRSASLDLISTMIGVDKASIKRDIEPSLIYKNLITITSRGRSMAHEFSI